MTDAQVKLIIEGALDRGRKLSWREAKVIFGCKELLTSDPDNEVAKTVYEDYTRYITGGVPVTGFGEFVLPNFETDEERAETLAKRARFLNYYANGTGGERSFRQNVAFASKH